MFAFSCYLIFAGFVIIGGENVGKLDLGIFIASVIPGGPADRAGNIKPGHFSSFLIRIKILA